mmetsp:Transcript_10823/g.28991  ORF Transcript_10823/g.28991 Transcript_10823/m.28991 type:complete len:237 (-) Transcript_10823:1222-1932(-)
MARRSAAQKRAEFRAERCPKMARAEVSAARSWRWRWSLKLDEESASDNSFEMFARGVSGARAAVRSDTSFCARSSRSAASFARPSRNVTGSISAPPGRSCRRSSYTPIHSSSSTSTASSCSASRKKRPFSDTKNSKTRICSSSRLLSPPRLTMAETCGALCGDDDASARRESRRVQRMRPESESTMSSRAAASRAGFGTVSSRRSTYGYAASTILKFGSNPSAMPSRMASERIMST